MLPFLQPEAFPLYLAPMAGFTDIAYRGLCKRYGADVLVTEFSHAEALLRGAQRAWLQTQFPESQRPLGIQLFGSCPRKMAEAARLIQEKKKPCFIDINYGCPAPKVTEQCAGSGLLKDLPLMEAIARAVNDAVALPVTAKIRIGWCEESVVAMEACQRLEAAGMQAVAVHGRTRTQRYKGCANWEVIAQCVRAVNIPIIGNGDAGGNLENFVRIAHESGVHGLMVGRAALGRPWVFRELKAMRAALLAGESNPALPPPPSLEEQQSMLLAYAQEMLAVYPHASTEDIRQLRPKLIKLTKGMPGGKALRGALGDVTTMAELQALCSQAEAASPQMLGHV